jgi:RNA polymerase sigma-70 factor, ECF subfamily
VADPGKGTGAPIPAGTRDEVLIHSIAGGDREALARLYDRYSGTLVPLAERLLGAGKREAQDLVHDVFLEVWRQAGDYDEGRGSARGWILMRLRSRALDRKKSPGVRRAVALDDTRVAEEAKTDEDPALAPDRTAVRRALGTLPEDQRTCVELAYFEGLSSSEIAERIGVPIGTVKSRVAAAFSKLREALGRGRDADRGKESR